MRPIAKITAILFFCFYFNVGKTQSVSTAVEGLEYWFNTFPQEKIYLQIDKNQIVAGDEIWFKAWCTYNGKPSFLSKIIYVDLVDSIGNVVQKKMFRIDSNASSIRGVMDIDNKFKSGNYSLNAYTLWMLNFPDFTAKQGLFIYGSDYITKKPIFNKSKTIKIQFFPEGGNIILGVANRIAFKATDGDGNPISIVGKIIDKNNQLVTDFSVDHDGMGMFTFEPKDLSKFYAVINTSNGASPSFLLPEVKAEGINLTVYNGITRISVVVNRGEVNKDKYNKSIILAHMNGKLVYGGEFDFNEGKTATSISKKALKPGILHLTVFDSLSNPLCERLAFIENYNFTVPNVSIQAKDLAKRGKNTISFQLENTVDEDISVLVKSGNKNDSLHSFESIASSIFLTSDLKGYIPNSHYYFSNKSETVLKRLDLLMMTHGWRRFSWNNIVKKIDPELKFPIESAMSIKGKVTKSGRQEIIKDGKISFIIKGEDSTKIIADAYLTDKGEFILDSLSYKRKATIYYEAQNNKKEKLAVDVSIYPAYVDSLKKSKLAPSYNLDTTDISARRSEFAQFIYGKLGSIDTLNFGGTNLAAVTVTTKKLSPLDSLQKEYVSPLFSVSDNTIDFENAKGMQNIWQYLRGQIPGFDVDPFTGGATARFTRNDGIRGLSDDESNDGIKFMLNEIEVSAIQLDVLSPEDVAIVKVYKGNTAFAWGANMGMIAVYTKKGTIVKSSPYEKIFTKFDKMGYETNREFYNLDYSKSPGQNSNRIDKRQTLYWNPKPKKDKTGKYQFNYYNNDLTNINTLLIQGIDKNGTIIFYQVKIE